MSKADTKPNLDMPLKERFMRALRIASFLITAAVLFQLIVLQWIFSLHTIANVELFFVGFCLLDTVAFTAMYAYYSFYQKGIERLLDLPNYIQVFAEKPDKNAFDRQYTSEHKGEHVKNVTHSFGLTWNEFRKLNKTAMEDYQIIKETMGWVRAHDLLPGDKQYIKRQLARRSFDTARNHFTEAREKYQRLEEKRRKVLEKAKAADCQTAVEKCLQEEGGFNGPRHAESVIARVQHLRSEAKKYDIEEAVADDLRAGNFNKVESCISHERNRHQRQNSKNRELAVYRRRIEKLANGNALPSHTVEDLRDQLEELEATEYRTSDYKKRRYALDNELKEHE